MSDGSPQSEHDDLVIERAVLDVPATATQTQGPLGSVESPVAATRLETQGHKGKRQKPPGRPPVFAKVAKWEDIPNWYSRTDTPLLRLPDVVLDRCFSLDTGLSIRDYVALAGVNKFFRRQMDDRFFEEVCRHFEGLPNDPVLCSDRLFSRHVDEWFRPRLRHSIRDNIGPHYVPRGDRPDWSKCQYAVYRQERDIQIGKERIERYKKGLEAAKRRAARVGQILPHPPVEENGYIRRVIGVVSGRPNGAPPARKEEETADPALYVDRVQFSNRSTLFRNREWTDEGLATLIAGVEAQVDKAKHPASSEHINSYNSDYEEDDVEVELHRPSRGQKRKRTSRVWVVPSSPSESDEDLVNFEYDDDGEPQIVDQWPSRWRGIAVNLANEARINKKAAKEKYKLTEAELLPLRHVLVVSVFGCAWMLYKSAPKQLFIECAVEALAFRLHGGPIGHQRFVEQWHSRSMKNRATRAINKEKKLLNAE